MKNIKNNFNLYLIFFLNIVLVIYFPVIALCEKISVVLEFKESCKMFFTPFLIEFSQSSDFIKEFGIITFIDKNTGEQLTFTTTYYIEKVKNNNDIINDFWSNKSLDDWRILYEKAQQRDESGNVIFNENEDLLIDTKKLWYLIAEDFEFYINNQRVLNEHYSENIKSIQNNVKKVLEEYSNQTPMSYYRKKHIGSIKFINNFIDNLSVDWRQYANTWDYSSAKMQYIKDKYVAIPHNSYYFFDFIKDITVNTYENTIKNSKEIILPLFITNIIFFCYLFWENIDMYLNLDNAMVLYYDFEFLTPGAVQFYLNENFKIFYKFLFLNVVCYFLYKKNNNNEIKNINTTLDQDFNSSFEYFNNKYFYNFIFYIIIFNIITFYPFRYYYFYRLKNDK